MDFVVFCNTDLGFSLAVTVEHNETVRDLKRKIIIEHAAIFKDFGGVKIVAVKAQFRGEFYHLPDSMVVSKVHTGDIEKCFQIDAA